MTFRSGSGLENLRPLARNEAMHLTGPGGLMPHGGIGGEDAEKGRARRRTGIPGLKNTWSGHGGDEEKEKEKERERETSSEEKRDA